MREPICIYLSPANRARLEKLLADRNTPRKVIWRADIVLATADGLGTMAIMRRTGKSKPCVWRWQERYVAEGVEGLLRDKTRLSRKKPLALEVKLKVLTKTANEAPANATHWSVRTMAKEIGISHTSVQRIWAEAGLKPHLTRKFSSPTIRTSSKRLRTSLGSTSIRQTRRWCSASTKKVRFRPLTGHSPAYL
jgi:transposase